MQTNAGENMFTRGSSDKSPCSRICPSGLCRGEHSGYLDKMRFFEMPNRSATYTIPVDAAPAVTIPCLFLKGAQNSVIPQSGRKTGPYGVQLKTFGLKEKLLGVASLVVIIALISLVSTLVYTLLQPKPRFDDSEMTYTRDHVGMNGLTSFLRVYKLPNRTDQSELAKSAHLSEVSDDGRQPCVGKCWVYSAFNFRSICQAGYCRCRGEHYDHTTCLPSVHGCKIQQKASGGSASFDNKTQPVYSCSTNKKDSAVHVISIYGHHNSPITTVDVRTVSSTNQPVTLILANYFPTTWRLALPENVLINKIILVSNDHVSSSSCQIYTGSTQPRERPVMRKVSIPVGYGDDRHGGHTVGLLQYVIKHYGVITSFNGAHYADHWDLNLAPRTEETRHQGLSYNQMIKR